MKIDEKPFKIWKNLPKLEEEFKDIEPNLAQKTERYLKRAGEFFHDTEGKVVKSNYKNLADYLLKLATSSLQAYSVFIQNNVE